MITIEQFYPINLIICDNDKTLLYKHNDNKYYKITKKGGMFNLEPHDYCKDNMDITVQCGSTSIPNYVQNPRIPTPERIPNLGSFNKLSPSPDIITNIIKPIARRFKPPSGGKTKHKKRGFSRRKKIKTRKHKKR